MIWVVPPGSGSWFLPIPDPGPKGQKGTRSRIRIRNTDLLADASLSVSAGFSTPSHCVQQVIFNILYLRVTEGTARRRASCTRRASRRPHRRTWPATSPLRQEHAPSTIPDQKFFPSRIRIFPARIRIFPLRVRIFPIPDPIFFRPGSEFFPSRVRIFPSRIRIFPSRILMFPSRIRIDPSRILIFPIRSFSIPDPHQRKFKYFNLKNCF